MEKNSSTVEAGETLSRLLEHAADNDVECFKRVVESDPSSIDEVGLWYCRQKGSKQMVYEHRTPLMVASLYGSVDIVRLILSLPIVDVNQSCGLDKATALHCASSGGSSKSVEVVKLLLKAGADPNAVDIHGHRPIDVINIPLKLSDLKLSLEKLLSVNGYLGNHSLTSSVPASSTPKSDSPGLSSSPGNGSSSSSASESPLSPINQKFVDQPVYCSSERKEYPVDPSLPDIKTGIFSTDEFRMYSFKVRSCSRAYAHDWTECPFVHPGENARRRDPRKYHYSCVPCPDFRKGSCRKGDMCEYAHGVFESWLHPAQYRTRICKDGTNCDRRVCFFAHTAEELRPLYVSAGSAHSYPRCNSTMETASSVNFFSGSPSSVMSPSAFTPPMSPSGSGTSHSSVAWPQPDVPSLRLPGSNIQSSRLRSSLSARDMIPVDDLDSLMSEFDYHHQLQQQQRLLNEFSCLSVSNSNSVNRAGRLRTFNPSNLDNLFSSESSSPRHSDQALASSATYSPTHKSAVLNQFQHQQTMLSPINTSRFSQENVDHPSFQAPSKASFSGRMSPRSVDPISPISSGASLMATQQPGQLHSQFRSLSSRDVGMNVAAIVGSPVSSWSRWVGSSNEHKPDWSFDVDQPQGGRMRRSSSFEVGGNGEEPDLSWVHSLVKEPPSEIKEKRDNNSSFHDHVPHLDCLAESSDHSVIGSWVRQMQT